MKRTLLLIGLAATLMTGIAIIGAVANQGNPQGGYTIWHQTNNNNGRYITVDQAGCIEHLASHPLDEGDCGLD